jgi:SNF2 family DNA or RNA helicase
MSGLEDADDALNECILAARFPCTLPGDVVRALAAAHGNIELAAAALLKANEMPATGDASGWFPALLGPAPGRRPLPPIQPDSKRTKFDHTAQAESPASMMKDVEPIPVSGGDEGEAEDEDEDVVIRRILERQREVRELEREHAVAAEARRAARKAKLDEQKEKHKQKKNQKKAVREAEQESSPVVAKQEKEKPPKRASGRKRLRCPAPPTSSDTEGDNEAPPVAEVTEAKEAEGSGEEVEAVDGGDADARMETADAHLVDEDTASDRSEEEPSEAEEEDDAAASSEGMKPAEPIRRSDNQRARCATSAMFDNPRVAAVRSMWKAADLIWMRICQPVFMPKTSTGDGEVDSDDSDGGDGASRSKKAKTKKSSKKKKRGAKDMKAEQVNRYVLLEVQEFVQNRQTGKWFVDLQMRDNRHAWLEPEQLFRVNVDDTTLLWLQPLPEVEVTEKAKAKPKKAKAKPKKAKPVLAPPSNEQYNIVDHRTELSKLPSEFQEGDVHMKMVVAAKSSWNRSTTERLKKNTDVLPEQLDALTAVVKQWCADHPEDRKMTKAKLAEKLRTTLPTFLNDVPNLFLMSPHDEQKALRSMCRHFSPGEVVKVAFPSLEAKSKQLLLCVVESIDLKHGVTMRPWELLSTVRVHWAELQHRVAFIDSDPFADDALLDFPVIRMDAARVSLFDKIIKSDMLEFFRPQAPLLSRRSVNSPDENDISQPGAPVIEDDDAAAPTADADRDSGEAEDMSRGVLDSDLVLTLDIHVASRTSYSEMACGSEGTSIRLSAVAAVRVDAEPPGGLIATPTGGTPALNKPLLQCFRHSGLSKVSASMLPLFRKSADERRFRKAFHADPRSPTLSSSISRRDVNLFLMPLRIEYCRRVIEEQGSDCSIEFNEFVAGRQSAFNQARRELRAAKIAAPRGTEFLKNLRTATRKGHTLVYFCDPAQLAQIVGVDFETPVAFNPDEDDRASGVHCVYDPYVPDMPLPSVDALQGVAPFPTDALRVLPTYEELKAACPGEIDAYDDDRETDDDAAASVELLPSIATAKVAPVAAAAAAQLTPTVVATPSTVEPLKSETAKHRYRGNPAFRNHYQPLYLSPGALLDEGRMTSLDSGRQPVGRSALLPVPKRPNNVCSRCNTTMHSKMDCELFSAKYPDHAHLCPVLFLSPYYFYCMRVDVSFRQLRSGMFTPVLSQLFPSLAPALSRIATHRTPAFELDTKDLLQRSAEHWHSVDWHSKLFEESWTPKLQTILSQTPEPSVLSKKTGKKLKPKQLASTPGDSELVRCFQAVFHRAGVAPSVLVRDYQVQAVCWMLHQEAALAQGCAPEQSVAADATALYAPFITRVDLSHPRSGAFHLWYSSFTNTWMPRAPPLVCGGVLGDHMGIGKTVEVLAAVALDRQLRQQGLLTSDKDQYLSRQAKKKKQQQQQQNSTTARGVGQPVTRDKFGFVISDATLIVAPLSVSTQWVEEISKRAPGLRTLYFHTSTTRGVDLSDETVVGSDAYDIVVVPSSTLGTSFSAAEKVRTQLLRTSPWEFDFSSPVRYLSVLHRIRFRRLVVDESHKDRTGTSQVAWAIHALPIPRRFKVSGTPLGDSLAHFKPHLSEMGLDSYAFGPSFWRAVDYATNSKLPSISNQAILSNRDRLQLLPWKRMTGQTQPAGVSTSFSSSSGLTDVDLTMSSSPDADDLSESDEEVHKKPRPKKVQEPAPADDEVMIIDQKEVCDIDAPIPPLVAMRNMLDLLLKNVLLRRKGGMPYRGRPKLLELTALRQRVIHVDMSPQQAAIYNLRLDAARVMFETFEERGELGRRTLVLKRCLEQVEIYCSYAHVPNAATVFSEFLVAVAKRLEEKEQKHSKKKDDAEVEKLLKGVEEAASGGRPRAKVKCMSESDECAVCIELYEDPVQLKHCNHMFCSECLIDILSLMADARGYAECPLCRGKYSRDDFCAPYVEAAPVAASAASSAPGSSPDTAMDVDSVEEARDDADSSASGASTALTMDAKLNALMKYLEEVRAEDPAAKVVIFTQYRANMAAIRKALDDAEIGACQIDGTMSPSKRTSQLKQFDTNPDIRAIVLSARTSADGLTLTAASRLVLFDPIASPSKAAQAIKRIWRFGQVKDVEICWLLMNNTIEIAKHAKCQERIVDCLEDEEMDEAAGDVDASAASVSPAAKVKPKHSGGSGSAISDVCDLFFMKPLELPSPNPFLCPSPSGGDGDAAASSPADVIAMSDL